MEKVAAEFAEGGCSGQRSRRRTVWGCRCWNTTSPTSSRTSPVLSSWRAKRSTSPNRCRPNHADHGDRPTIRRTGRSAAGTTRQRHNHDRWSHARSTAIRGKRCFISMCRPTYAPRRCKSAARSDANHPLAEGAGPVTRATPWCRSTHPETIKGFGLAEPFTFTARVSLPAVVSLPQQRAALHQKALGVIAEPMLYLAEAIDKRLFVAMLQQLIASPKRW